MAALSSGYKHTDQEYAYLSSRIESKIQGAVYTAYFLSIISFNFLRFHHVHSQRKLDLF